MKKQISKMKFITIFWMTVYWINNLNINIFWTTEQNWYQSINFRISKTLFWIIKSIMRRYLCEWSIMLEVEMFFLQKVKISWIILHSQMGRSLSVCLHLQFLSMASTLKLKKLRNQLRDFKDFKNIINFKSKCLN